MRSRVSTISSATSMRNRTGCGSACSRGAPSMGLLIQLRDGLAKFGCGPTRYPCRRPRARSRGFLSPAQPRHGLEEMARGEVRIAVTLACEECKRRNYQTNKNRRNDPERIEMRKYCRWCGHHTPHKETR